MSKELHIDFKGQKLKGTLITEDEKTLTLKLSSGYNAVLNKSEITVSQEKIHTDATKKVVTTKIDSNLPKIVIIHTGGTIASKVDYATGAVSSKFSPEELIAMYPELLTKANISAKKIGNMFSEDIRFAHYNVMIKEVLSALKESPIGIIISHGTDTMHYTSSALSYALQHLPVPILLVGAQRSSDRPSSDAYSNLSTAVDFLIENSKKENAYRRVGICMHKSLSDTEFVVLDGINAKKLHTTRRDAFKPVNVLPFAIISSGKVQILREELLSVKPSNKVESTLFDESLKIGFFKTHPNLFPQEIEALSIYDAVIIEGTGLGHIAINEVDENTKLHPKNLKALEQLAKKIPVVMSSQCVFGQTNMNVYSTGRYQLDAGVLGNYSLISSESTFIKVAYCLSKDRKKFKDLFESNLEGFSIRNIETKED